MDAGLGVDFGVGGSILLAPRALGGGVAFRAGVASSIGWGGGVAFRTGVASSIVGLGGGVAVRAGVAGPL